MSNVLKCDNCGKEVRDKYFLRNWVHIESLGRVNFVTAAGKTVDTSIDLCSPQCVIMYMQCVVDQGKNTNQTSAIVQSG